MTTAIAKLRDEYLTATGRADREWMRRAGATRTVVERKLDLWREASVARDKYVLARLDELEAAIVPEELAEEGT